MKYYVYITQNEIFAHVYYLISNFTYLASFLAQTLIITIFIKLTLYAPLVPKSTTVLYPN